MPRWMSSGWNPGLHCGPGQHSVPEVVTPETGDTAAPYGVDGGTVPQFPLPAVASPGCGLPVALPAAIGKVESGHARGGRVDAGGTALAPILGPVLDGRSGTAAIADTDSGVLDGDAAWDRAVGPMQFIPSTWRRWVADGNGDGRADPENVSDAAVLSYNHSAPKVRVTSSATSVTVIMPRLCGNRENGGRERGY